MKEILIFNQKGTKYGKMPVPPLVYLKTEKEWIDNAVLRAHSDFDGAVLLIDWERRTITPLR